MCSQEFKPLKDILEVAITKYDTYEDRYVKVIVRDAQLLSRDPHNKSIVDRRVYAFSSTLSKMSLVRLQRFNPDALTRDDFKEILSYFNAL